MFFSARLINVNEFAQLWNKLEDSGSRLWGRRREAKKQSLTHFHFWFYSPHPSCRSRSILFGRIFFGLFVSRTLRIGGACASISLEALGEHSSGCMCFAEGIQQLGWPRVNRVIIPFSHHVTITFS